VGGKHRLRMTLPSGDRKPIGTFDTWEEAEGASDAIASAARDTPGLGTGQALEGVPDPSTISERDTRFELATFGLGSRRSTN
jgi:hypothetical protein